MLVLAGCMASCASWTKNEGTVFVLVVVLIRGTVGFLWKGWKTGGQELSLFLVGAAPLLCVLLVFKGIYTPPNDLLAADVSWLAQLLDGGRYSLIARSFVWEWWTFGEWPWPMLAVLYGYLLLVGVHVSKREAPSVLSTGCIFVLMLLAYFAVYLFSYHNLVWHIDTSMHRLVMQWWPSFLLLFFLVTPLPYPALGIKQALFRGGCWRNFPFPY